MASSSVDGHDGGRRRSGGRSGSRGPAPGHATGSRYPRRRGTARPPRKRSSNGPTMRPTSAVKARLAPMTKPRGKAARLGDHRMILQLDGQHQVGGIAAQDTPADDDGGGLFGKGLGHMREVIGCSTQSSSVIATIRPRAARSARLRARARPGRGSDSNRTVNGPVDRPVPDHRRRGIGRAVVERINSIVPLPGCRAAASTEASVAARLRLRLRVQISRLISIIPRPAPPPPAEIAPLDERTFRCPGGDIGADLP